jgi:hypothetical protein
MMASSHSLLKEERKALLLIACLLLGACDRQSHSRAQWQSLSRQSAAAPAVLQPTAPAPPTRADFTSVYTALDLARCKVVEQQEAGSTSRCAGYAGIPLFVDEGDLRFDVSAGAVGRDDPCSAFPGCAFDLPGTEVEWRLLHGRPFAIIYRLVESGDPKIDRAKPSRLIVETVGSKGCRIANIDGASLNANLVARRAADASLSGKPHCIDAAPSRWAGGFHRFPVSSGETVTFISGSKTSRTFEPTFTVRFGGTI